MVENFKLVKNRRFWFFPTEVVQTIPTYSSNYFEPADLKIQLVFLTSEVCRELLVMM